MPELITSFMELYKEFGYSEETGRDKLAQLNRSLRNFLLRQERLPKDIIEATPLLARGLAEQFCAIKRGEKTNAEIFWPPQTACSGRQPVWPQDEADIIKLVIRLIFRHTRNGLRNGPVNSDVKQSIGRRNGKDFDLEGELGQKEYTHRGTQSRPLRVNIPSNPTAGADNRVPLARTAKPTEHECIQYFWDIGPPLQKIYQNTSLSPGWLENDTAEWPLEKKNMIIKYMHKHNLYVKFNQNLGDEEAFKITEMIIKDTPLALCSKIQRRMIQARINGLLRTQTVSCMACGFIEQKDGSLVKTPNFSSAWDKLSRLSPYSSPDRPWNSPKISNKEIDIYAVPDDDEPTPMRPGRERRELMASHPPGKRTDGNSDTNPEDIRAKRPKTSSAVKPEKLSPQAEVQLGSIRVQTIQNTWLSCHNENTRQAPGTGNLNSTTRSTRPSLVIILKCALPNGLQAGYQKASPVAYERWGDINIGSRDDIHQGQAAEMDANLKIDKSLHCPSLLARLDSFAFSRMEDNVLSYSPNTLPTPISPTSMDYDKNNSTLNPEIRISIFRYQDGIPFQINAIPIHSLPGLIFSTCTVHEFFAWYHKAANVPGDPSSLQALVFQYPWNLMRKRAACRIEADDDAEFEDWRENLKEGVAETRRAYQEGVLPKRLAMAAGRFKVDITEPYMSGVGRDITNILR